MSEAVPLLVSDKDAQDIDEPKSFQNASIRRTITLSYWIVIALCVPYWWYSTTIERHSIPLNEIAKWQSRGPCPIKLPIPLYLTGPGLRMSQVIASLEEESKTRGRCNYIHRSFSNNSHCLSFNLALGNQDSVTLIGEKHAEITMTGYPGVGSSIAKILMPYPPAQGPGDQFSTDPRAVKYAGRYKLVFSLLNEDVAQGGVVEWDIASVLQREIYPLLRSLEDLHTFDVETQMQYYSPLLIERTMTEEGAIIEEDQLKAFVNTAEWNLASAVSTDPVLHFILYVPSSKKSPLLVRLESGEIRPLTSFLTPQWGSIVIASTSTSQLTSTHLAAPFQIFSSHLRKLLGVPSIPHGAAKERQQWEAAALMRERIGQNVVDSIDRLGAIARQITEIQNMRIPMAVQNDVKGALEALAKVETADLKESMAQSAKAIELATRAAFNHEMLAMLYFPDEHKWAVYTPLFGPIAVPLLVALIREIKEYRKRRKDKIKTE